MIIIVIRWHNFEFLLDSHHIAKRNKVNYYIIKYDFLEFIDFDLLSDLPCIVNRNIDYITRVKVSLCSSKINFDKMW